MKSYNTLCFNCRVSFKRSAQHNDYPGITGEEHTCPNCGDKTYSVIGVTKPPKKRDKKAWKELYERVKFIFENREKIEP